MKYSDLFGKTKRDAPSEMADEALKLAFRGGLMRPAGDGQFLYLPLGANVIAQMLAMLRGDLEELGAQEVRGLPQVDLNALAGAEIQSYKQLPVYVHWYSGGLTRLHLAALVPSAAQAVEVRDALKQLAADFFEYAGIEPVPVVDLNEATAWFVSAPNLGTEILRSPEYAATRRAAVPYKAAAVAEAPLPLQEVETPHADTIEGLAQFLNVPTSRTAKAVFYAGDNKLVFAVVRGDLQIDEDKVKRALGIQNLRWATEDEIIRAGATPGYASPVGIRNATVIVDDSIANSPNLVAGANKAGYHLLNTNVPREYKPDMVTDIALARPGDASPDGKGTFEAERGALLGSLSAARELPGTFLDPNGKAQKVIALTLDFDLGSTLLAHVAAHRDAKGIVWTRAIAPFDVEIVALNADKPEVAAALAQVTDAVEMQGLDVLVDDRSESAGIKFNDADLLGAPLRITLGPKTLAQGAVEVKPRAAGDVQIVPLDTFAGFIENWMTNGGGEM